jgi:hypothetical protein
VNSTAAARKIVRNRMNRRVSASAQSSASRRAGGATSGSAKSPAAWSRAVKAGCWRACDSTSAFVSADASPAR